MLRFAANISFLFKELPFLDRFAAASEAGFKLVECHWPYDNSIDALRERLERSRLSLVMVNTAPGNLDAGDFGLGAMPGREADFQAALDQSLHYVSALGATRIHCMAGKVPVTATAHRTFVDNLRRGADKARDKGVTMVIEPLNTRSAPGYFLTHAQQAVDIIGEVDRPNVKLLFDVFHLQIMDGDIITRLEKLLPCRSRPCHRAPSRTRARSTTAPCSMRWNASAMTAWSAPSICRAPAPTRGWCG
jgi:hydroxypyruvate isomerase